MDALIEALEARDAYTASHGLRVAHYVHAMAQELSLPEEAVNALTLAARVHDIGKIGIPDAILLKPGPLTVEESTIIRSHTQVGRKILAKIQGFGTLLAVAELHHENYDGSGYPVGLAGRDIPFPARIVRVADAYDAMITNRVYRPAHDSEAALDFIRSRSGAYFDPVVVAAFEVIVKASSMEQSIRALSMLCSSGAGAAPEMGEGVTDVEVLRPGE